MIRKSVFLEFAATSFAFLLALTTGCGSGSHSSTPGGPSGNTSGSFSVSSTTPATGATQVATSGAILITFSAAANAATVNTTDIKLTGPNNSAVAGAVTYNATTFVATFTPAAALTANTTYTLSVSGVTSSGGAAMGSAYTSTFTTASSTSSSGGGTVQFEATIGGYNSNSGGGTISITTTGAVTFQLAGAAASTTYAAEFCPTYTLYTQTPYPCISLGNVTTNASGSATTTTQFPQAGSWAGDFNFNIGSTTWYTSQLGPAKDTPSEVYTATLQPEDTVNGKGDSKGPDSPQSPLTSGNVTFSTSGYSGNGTVTFTLTGALPDTEYNAAESGVLGGSQTYALYNTQMQSVFTTNAQGDVTFSVGQDGTEGDLFLIELQNGNQAGYISGFSVP